MILQGDYHTHTTFSSHNHGKGTIEQNVQAAVNKGLKEIAITDHGFMHGFYPVKRSDISVMRDEIERLKKIYPINIYFGLETNLIGFDGTIDLTGDEEKLLDIVLVGYHKTAKAKSVKDFFAMFAPNYLENITRFITKKQIQKNTDAYLRMIDKNNVDVITHLNYGMQTNTLQVAKLALQRDVLIELNGKRTLFTPDEIAEMIEIKTKFIINSDAHCPSHVGECNLPTNIAILNKIPTELIVNVNNLPKFKNHRK